MVEDDNTTHECSTFEFNGSLGIYFPEKVSTYSIYVTYNTYSLNSRVLCRSGQIANGTITDAKSSTGANSFKLEATDNVLVQVPLVYYPGYQIKLTDDTGKVTYAKEIMTDGLVSFEASAGTYNVEITYTGTNIRRASNAIFKISLIGIFVFSCYGILIERKRKQDLY